MSRVVVSSTWQWSKGGDVEYSPEIPEAARVQITELIHGWDQAFFGRGPLVVSPLRGGANNRNYLVRGPGVKYALRVASHQNTRLAIDRASALTAQRDAAAIGLAPTLLAYRLPEGHLLSQFVEGPALAADLLGDRDVLALVGRTLRRLHTARSSCRAFSPFDNIRQWVEVAQRDGTALPDDLDELVKAAGHVEHYMLRARLPVAFCHNDPFPSNFIRSADQLTLVDWDYAGRGWACFELGSFCATADLDPDFQAVVLEAYDPAVTSEQRASVEVLRFVAALREATWALVAAPLQAGVPPPEEGWTWQGYLEECLATARKIAGEQSFGSRVRLIARRERGSW